MPTVGQAKWVTPPLERCPISSSSTWWRKRRAAHERRKRRRNERRSGRKGITRYDGTLDACRRIPPGPSGALTLPLESGARDALLPRSIASSRVSVPRKPRRPRLAFHAAGRRAAHSVSHVPVGSRRLARFHRRQDRPPRTMGRAGELPIPGGRQRRTALAFQYVLLHRGREHCEIRAGALACHPAEQAPPAEG